MAVACSDQWYMPPLLLRASDTFLFNFVDWNIQMEKSQCKGHAWMSLFPRCQRLTYTLSITSNLLQRLCLSIRCWLDRKEKQWKAYGAKREVFKCSNSKQQTSLKKKNPTSEFPTKLHTLLGVQASGKLSPWAFRPPKWFWLFWILRSSPRWL